MRDTVLELEHHTGHEVKFSPSETVILLTLVLSSPEKCGIFVLKLLF